MAFKQTLCMYALNMQIKRKKENAIEQKHAIRAKSPSFTSIHHLPVVVVFRLVLVLFRPLKHTNSTLKSSTYITYSNGQDHKHIAF